MKITKVQFQSYVQVGTKHTTQLNEADFLEATLHPTYIEFLTSIGVTLVPLQNVLSIEVHKPVTWVSEEVRAVLKPAKKASNAK